jgi:hypothetical protein
MCSLRVSLSLVETVALLAARALRPQRVIACGRRDAGSPPNRTQRREDEAVELSKRWSAALPVPSDPKSDVCSDMNCALFAGAAIESGCGFGCLFRGKK